MLFKTKKAVSPIVLILIICLTLSVFLNVITVSAVQDSWTTLKAMPIARSGLEVVSVNGKIYAIGGSTAEGHMPSIPGGAVLGNIDIDEIVGVNKEYNPITNTWSTKASMITSRIIFASVVYQNRVYCIGGKTNDGYTSVNEIYDPETDTWETKTPMPIAIGWITAEVVDNKIYVISVNSTQVYDPKTDSWSVLTAPPKATAFVGGCVSAVFESKIYVFGGLSQDQHYMLTQIYNPKTDAWTQGASPPAGICSGVAIATTGEFAPKGIYVLSGAASYYSGAPENTTQFYDPKTNNWTLAPSIPTGRYNFGAAAINDTIYVIGGHTYNVNGRFAPSPANEQYTPTGYIPEFSSWLVFPLFFVATITVIVTKIRFSRKRLN
jgi:N-acetylneuraminic acid mutarotase